MPWGKWGNSWRKPKGKRNGKKKNGADRSHGDRVLGQGVGAYPRKPFAARRAVRDAPSSSRILSTMRVGLNARHPVHVGLPRPVGPYTVIRTTRTFSTNAAAVMVGCFRTGADWRNVCAIEDKLRATPINAANGTKQWNMPFATNGVAFEWCPAALTVQLMNSNPLQTTEGVVLATRVNQQCDFSDSTETWDQTFGNIMNFFPPRLCSAGKLALRGVECDAYPLNMSDFSNFSPARIGVGDNDFTWSGDVMTPAGLSPIVVYQPGASTVELTYVVTIEWRVRFDPLNPASGSHSHHDSTPDSWWNAAIKSASEQAHGIKDIVENVANIGQDVARAYRAIAPALA